MYHVRRAVDALHSIIFYRGFHFLLAATDYEQVTLLWQRLGFRFCSTSMEFAGLTMPLVILK